MNTYLNDYLYFALKPAGSGDMMYCSGVDLYRFLPITEGRHRPMSNPVLRGLQLVNLGVRRLALDRGATPETVSGDMCDGIVPLKTGWYKETILLKNVPPSFFDEMITYCVNELLRKIDRAIMLQAELPEKLLSPEELKTYLDDMCHKYGA